MITVALGPFARLGIEKYMGDDLAIGVRKALIHHANKIEVGRSPLPVPNFLPDLDPRRDPRLLVSLEIDRDTESRLEKEALQQGTTMSQLAVHAVMGYLAELEFLDAALRPTRHD